MKVLGLIEVADDAVNKAYVDDVAKNHQTHLEELDRKLGTNNTEFEKLNLEFSSLVNKLKEV